MRARSADSDRWQGRPGRARALRIAVIVAPLLASLAVVGVLSRLLGPVRGGWALVVRVLLLVALAMVAAAVTERLARRLLPLSILLELSMLFPDRAPSRIAVARRARTIARSPHELLERGDEDAASAAVRILALMSALAAHDRRTRGHAERVRAFTDLLAVQMRLPRADRDKLRWAALLHDIGKIGVAASLLNKPSALSSPEWETIKRHPAEGERLAGPLLEWLGEWGKAIVEHHERFDGSGYPMGLAGTGISRAGRMVGVVDAYETMTAARAYKKAFATRDARAELARNAGSQFDPTVVRAFLAVSLPRLLWASGPFSFLVQLPFLRVISEAGLRVVSASGSVVATTTAVAGAAVISLPVASLATSTTTHRLEQRLGTATAAGSVTAADAASRGHKAAVRVTPRSPSAINKARPARVVGATVTSPPARRPIAAARPIAGPLSPDATPARSAAPAAPALAAEPAPPGQAAAPTPVPEPSRSVAPVPQPSTIAPDSPATAPVSAAAPPKETPTVAPAPTPSAGPSAQPSAGPSAQPSAGPSAQPSAEPSAQPSAAPSAQPSAAPSAQQSAAPSAQQSAAPSAQPSPGPTTPAVVPTLPGVTAAPSVAVRPLAPVVGTLGPAASGSGTDSGKP